MKVLVIGGTRFFGKRLVSRLLKADFQVTLLNRGNSGDDFGSDVSKIVLDRKQLCSGHPALGNQSWDLVFDQVCYDAEEAQKACETFNGRVGRYIFTSSQSVYKPGENLKEENFDPSTYQFPKAVDRNQDYGEAKRQAEATFAQNLKMPFSFVRFPIVLGEDDYTERLAWHVRAISKGTPIYFPNIQSKISFINSSSAAEVLFNQCQNVNQGPLNACSTNPISLLELMSLIETLAGKKMQFALTSTKESQSPFGIEADWFMSTQKLKATGLHLKEINEWLPDLIKFYLQGFKFNS